jgi:hypothetical protein
MKHAIVVYSTPFLTGTIFHFGEGQMAFDIPAKRASDFHSEMTFRNGLPHAPLPC